VRHRSRVRGHIQKVYFTDGEMIDKNKPLFDLDPRPFQTEIDKANEKLKIYQAGSSEMFGAAPPRVWQIVQSVAQ
jgi:multidrug resistance efflux pump